MQFHIHHHAVPDRQTQQRLDLLLIHLEVVTRNQENAMATIKELVATVAAVKGRADSIAMLITQLREQIIGLLAGNLPPDVQAQVDQAFADAEAAKTELSAAVDNTGGTSAPDSFSTATGQAPDPTPPPFTPAA